jgi:hypothetical protein
VLLKLKQLHLKRRIHHLQLILKLIPFLLVIQTMSTSTSSPHQGKLNPDRLLNKRNIHFITKKINRKIHDRERNSGESGQSGYEIVFNNVTSLKNSKLRPNAKLVILIHGYASNISDHFPKLILNCMLAQIDKELRSSSR